jgi:hypothetical protein
MDRRRIAEEFRAAGHPLGVNEKFEVLHLTHDDMARPVLAIGDTASGKTELLLALVGSALAAGSGVTIVDGKGDLQLGRRLASMTMSLGRRSDLRVVDLLSPRGGRTSERSAFDPLASGSAEDLSEMLVELAFEGAGGDMDRWKDQSRSLLLPLMQALVWRRDRQGASLDMNRVREAMYWDELETLSIASDLPEAIRAGLRAYIESTPFYVKGQKAEQRTLEHHGYATMSLGRVLIQVEGDPVAATEVPSPEEFGRSISDRLITVVLLPSFAKDPARALECSDALMFSLEAALHAAISEAPGADGSDPFGEGGEFDDVRSLQPPGPPAHLLVLDDAADYAIAGIDDLAGWAGKLGISLVFGITDKTDLARWSGRGLSAKAILAHCPTQLTLVDGTLEVVRGGTLSRTMPI